MAGVLYSDLYIYDKSNSDRLERDKGCQERERKKNQNRTLVLELVLYLT